MWSCRQKWGYVDSINRIRGGILKVGKVVEVCKNYKAKSGCMGRVFPKYILSFSLEFLRVSAQKQQPSNFELENNHGISVVPAPSSS